MLRLVRFFMPCGRQGDIEGLFVLNDNGWKTLNQHVNSGSTMSFYEVLGKHSQIVCPISEDHITMVSDDQSFLENLIKFVGWHISGVYLLDYLEEDQSECDCDPDGDYKCNGQGTC